ncbi:carbohydrate porin [Thalassotalea fonticola]|uniref:Carbohydrate porin n=1 Tax=Thalassotalea fonticola TaxID=3065649 RepID=A0ABZ0GPZ2_9GAMM|nr:carbohydrate porin [Colwelliaceae bacterium S1-1]
MKVSTPLLGLLLASSTTALAAQADDKTQRLEQLEKQIAELKKEVNANTKSSADLTPKIKIGGAVRFQYSYEDYDDDNKDRGGDFDFDTFRLDVNGSIGDVRVSAQYRWYQYMDVVHHAYAAYDFNENWEGQVGITQVPFGNLNYNSNSFFFSSAYYAGLEDDYDTGLSFIGKYDNHDIRVAYFVNDELGGIDGYVDNKTDRYSYDVVGVRGADEGIWDAPATAMAESNTVNLRYAYKFDNTEVGASVLSGDLEGSTGSLGDHNAYAVHLKSNIGKFGIMAQYTSYEYDLDDNSDSVAVGAYSFHDTIPAEATLYNLNLSYSKDVTFGPITNLTFYNDYNLMTDKSGSYEEDTMMNVTGVAISAGGIYAYVDYIMAKNQPFIGGTMAGDSDETNNRLNINIGYYF